MDVQGGSRTFDIGARRREWEETCLVEVLVVLHSNVGVPFAVVRNASCENVR